MKNPNQRLLACRALASTNPTSTLAPNSASGPHQNANPSLRPMRRRLRLPTGAALGLVTGLLLQPAPDAHAELAVIPAAIGEVVLGEATKAVVTYLLGQAANNLRPLVQDLKDSWTRSTQPGLQLRVELTEHLRTTRRKYPHQPFTTQTYALKLVSGGYLVTRKTVINGKSTLESVVLPLAAVRNPTVTALPAWWLHPELNHLTRNCGYWFNGEYLEDFSDETFLLGVRAQGRRWRPGAGKRALATVQVSLHQLKDTCQHPLDTLSDGTPNARLGLALQAPVAIELDSQGNGMSQPLRVTGPKVWVEPGGLTPQVLNAVLVQETYIPVDK
jgi:hypothetical protein